MPQSSKRQEFAGRTFNDNGYELRFKVTAEMSSKVSHLKKL